MKTIITTAIAILFISLPILSQAESLETEVSPFSIRIRPMAIVFGIVGAEVYYEIPSGFFVGLSAFFFSGDNQDKETGLTNNEFGIKIGKFFGDHPNDSGWWIQGAVNYNHILVSSFYEPTNENLSYAFNEYSEALSIGYQFRMTFIDPERLNTRLGLGVDYKPPSGVEHAIAADGKAVPISVRRRLDPSIELTVGYLL